VSDPICVVCEKRPTPDGYACAGCAGRAIGKLVTIIDLAPDARLVAAGLVRRGNGFGSNKPGSRPPLNDSATDVMDEIQNTLTTLARDIAEARGREVPHSLRADPIVVAARWLAGQVEWLRHAIDGAEPRAVRAFDEIAVCAGRLRGIVNGPGEQKFLGPCGYVFQVDVTSLDREPETEFVDGKVCDGDVYAYRGARVGRCRTCGAEVATSERQAWLDGEVRSHAFRATEIAQAYAINVKTIRSWATERPEVRNADSKLVRSAAPARLRPHAHDRDGHPLYLLGDVLDLAAADAARREGNRSRRSRREAVS
jgi:hypothetical protein